ncbi:MAG: zinc ribbon domain-containing protein [Pseudomonadota bacterium]|nr:zinc ribbon domain-containing protein [Pseudomonadota bacterium]
MPIYEYQCGSCSHSLEALQKISDGPLLDCPACGLPSLKKLVSAASFRLKGGGWYETDFKTGDKKQLADSGGDSKVSGSESSGSGSKPADSKADKSSQTGKVSEGKPAGNAKSQATTNGR